MHWLVMAFCAGCLLAVQAAVNARLGKELGQSILAAFVSFAIGTVGIVLYCLLSRTAIPASLNVGRIPVWAWCGGILGAFYVAGAIVMVPRLGVGTMLSLIVGGQMAMSLLLDHYGLLGLERHPLTAVRVFGMILIIAGVVLIKRF